MNSAAMTASKLPAGLVCAASVLVWALMKGWAGGFCISTGKASVIGAPVIIGSIRRISAKVALWPFSNTTQTCGGRSRPLRCAVCAQARSVAAGDCGPRITAAWLKRLTPRSKSPFVIEKTPAR